MKTHASVQSATSPGVASDAADVNQVPRQPRSLFGEILVSMFIPLFMAWALSIVAIYWIAASLSNYPFDHALENNLRALAQQIKLVDGHLSFSLPQIADDLLHADRADPARIQVLGAQAELIAGDAQLPLPAADEWPVEGQVLFRNVTLNGIKLRVATMAPELPDSALANSSKPPLIQLAETLTKRTELSYEIIKGVILPQFVIVPIAVVLVWFGLYRGIRTLSRLQERIIARAPDDMRPIDPHEAPEEMTPLVDTFNQLLARLETNIKHQKRFIADAAHQMRTPLAGLRTQAELALRQTDPAEIAQSLKQLATSSERATRLVNQLLALARAENRSDSPEHFSPVDLEALARDVIKDWVPAALEKRIDLGYEGSDTALRISGNEVLLRELLKNLIDNALRYTAAGGRITVRVAADHDPVTGIGSAIMEVEDNGPGIAESDRALVLERFYRVLGNGSDGSGLGLAIVREIAIQHRARLILDRNLHCTDATAPGLSVRVIFPLLAPHQDIQYEGDA